MRGVISRRILLNFRVDPARLAALIPAPFRLQLVAGHAIAGICLIRLERLRPVGLPLGCGLSADNAAHRIAIEWDEAGQVRSGVWIARRDSGSRMVRWAGGRLFPGVHGRAAFIVVERDGHLAMEVATADGQQVRVRGEETDVLPSGSVFPDLASASAFFAAGSLGFSPAHRQGCCDAMELACDFWRMRALRLDEGTSTVFAALGGELDSALIMRGIPHRWRAHPQRRLAG